MKDFTFEPVEKTRLASVRYIPEASKTSGGKMKLSLWPLAVASVLITAMVVSGVLIYLSQNAWHF